MRIGVNCFMLRPHIGGMKQYFRNLFGWLLENDRQNEYLFFYFRHNVDELRKLRSDRWRSNAILLEDQSQILDHLGKIDLFFCPFGPLWPRPIPLPTVMMSRRSTTRSFSRPKSCSYAPITFAAQPLWRIA